MKHSIPPRIRPYAKGMILWICHKYSNKSSTIMCNLFRFWNAAYQIVHFTDVLPMPYTFCNGAGRRPAEPVPPPSGENGGSRKGVQICPKSCRRTMPCAQYIHDGDTVTFGGFASGLDASGVHSQSAGGAGAKRRGAPRPDRLVRRRSGRQRQPRPEPPGGGGPLPQGDRRPLGALPQAGPAVRGKQAGRLQPAPGGDRPAFSGTLPRESPQ